MNDTMKRAKNSVPSKNVAFFVLARKAFLYDSVSVRRLKIFGILLILTVFVLDVLIKASAVAVEQI